MDQPEYTIKLIAWSNGRDKKPFHVFEYDYLTEGFAAQQRVDQLRADGYHVVASFLIDKEGIWSGEWGTK